MAIPGYLELILGKHERLYGAKRDGREAYSAVEQYADLIRRVKDPAPRELREWFSLTAASLGFLETRWFPHAEHYVIITPKRKDIRYSNYARMAEFSPGFAGARAALKAAGYTVSRPHHKVLEK